MSCRQHLKLALALATEAQDNHLRALVLALISAHYFHTAGENAHTMLLTCDQLATGLGAPGTKSAGNEMDGAAEVTGNASLRLWVGERLVGE